MLIAGIDGNTLVIYDPYLYNGKFEINGRQGKVTVDGTTVYCNIDNFKNYANAVSYFCYKYDGQSSNPDAPTSPIVGKVRTFNKNTTIYENSNLTGREYSYLANTTVVILEDLGTIHKVRARQTGRVGYVNSVGLYKEDLGGSTVGQVKVFKENTIIYENSNLTGTKYSYLPNTTVTILQNLNGVDKVVVKVTGRTGYVANSVYK